MRQSGPSDSDILDYYIDILRQLDLHEQTIWREFRSISHVNFHCLFWHGSEESLVLNMFVLDHFPKSSNANN